MDEAQLGKLRGFIEQVVKTFYELEEAMPSKDEPSKVGISPERWKAIHLTDLPGALARAGFKTGFAYYGEGPVCLSLDWTKRNPHLNISVWRRNGKRCYAPADQAQTTFSRLQEACRKKGLDMDLFNRTVSFANN